MREESGNMARDGMGTLQGREWGLGEGGKWEHGEGWNGDLMRWEWDLVSVEWGLGERGSGDLVRDGMGTW